MISRKSSALLNPRKNGRSMQQIAMSEQLKKQIDAKTLNSPAFEQKGTFSIKNRPTCNYPKNYLDTTITTSSTT